MTAASKTERSLPNGYFVELADWRFQWQMMDAVQTEMESANAMFAYILKVGLASGAIIGGISIGYVGLGAILIGFRCVDVDHSGGDPIFLQGQK